MSGKLLASLAALAALGCSPKASGPHEGPGPGTAAGPHGPTFTLFAVAELRGQIEPCGCTTDPLGDLSRTVALVDAARAAGPVIVVDAGSTLFDVSPVPPERAAQERLKAQLIEKTYAGALQVAAWGVGPADLGLGPAAVQPPRQAVNVDPRAGIALAPPRIVEAGGAKVGIFGVVVPGAIDGVAAGDPALAAKAAVASLRGRGAQVVVALVQAPTKRAAVDLVRAVPGVDLAVAGLGALAPEPAKVDPRAEQVGGAWLVVPANRGQVVSRIAVTVRPGAAPLVDAVGPAAAAVERARLAERIAGLEHDLAAFARDASADPAFVARKKQELADVRAEDARLAADPMRAPAQGSYFTLAQVAIARRLACDAAVQEAKVAYNKAAGHANLEAARTRPPAPVPPGTATYVGAEECASCHGKEAAFWKKTRHAEAWKTLEATGKQYDYECTGCHVTGFGEPGGSTMAKTDGLQDVQCEVCHGPGSIHVEKEGEEKPLAIVRRPAADLCATRCHTPEHSDTFQLEAYLRDVTGPGHGGKARKALGDGPTGHALRAAGLAKAGKGVGAGCEQ
jgi:Cytochrome c554 and c-prime